MAKNELRPHGNTVSAVCSHPTTPASGDPVRIGEFCGVAQTDERADGTTTVKRDGTHTISVKGIDQSGNSAVAVGDILYYTDADSPPVSKKNTGRRFGYALGAVSSAATTSIEVLLGY